MNIAIVSSTSSYHQLAQMFLKESDVNHVYHYGAHPSLIESDRYHPVPIAIPILPINNSVEEEVQAILEHIKDKNIAFVVSSSVHIPSSKLMHNGLQELNIPYFFVNPEMTALEKNKSLTKKMLNSLQIPTAGGETVDGKYLFENFKSIPRPFVVKLNFVYQYGKQTIIVTDENYEEVYLDLFSVRLDSNSRITNINFNANLIIEKFVKIKREYSYHALFNNIEWKYLGSARDYKKIEDGDRGFNSVSMGSYNIDDIDPIVHEYTDKIFNFLKNRNYNYKGFIFLGIAVDENDVPMILEINTRSGDPELQAILGSVENNLGELFLAASNDTSIPEITHNDNKTVTIRLINNVYDWTKPASFLPKLESCPEEIVVGLEGTDPFYLKHSVFTASDSTHELAAKKIYKYLDKQFVGQYRYRRDIGILK
jgi:phosphoribosylamine--glycine ligase